MPEMDEVTYGKREKGRHRTEFWETPTFRMWIEEKSKKRLKNCDQTGWKT